MTLDELKVLLDAMPEQERVDLLSNLSRDYAGEWKKANQDRTMAADRIATPTPQGLKRGAYYTAADPLEQLAATANRGVGEYQNYQAGQRMEDLSRSRQGGVQSMMDLLRGGNMPATMGQNIPTKDPAFMARALRSWT